MQSIRTRGRTFTGTVVDAKMQKTATVEWPRRKFIRKYERYETSKTSVKAHNPENIDAKEGDIVKVMETRPLSKTKQFIIIEKIGHEKLFETKEELKEESKVVKREKEDERA
ncbi:30S ribosomal protein S17 [Candidatus Woesearchaeota archaeon]|nr:30S ribosomal protein S17 [Candidatus Woesearchaeota archaeon]MBW3016559.1 30S ribosomal protein S17 [Candidatus Woesearchaeota archaeon]